MGRDPKNRLETLRQQATQALAAGGSSFQAAGIDTTDLARLMEELCIYHEELQIQNDELSVAQTRASSAKAHYQTLFNLLPLPVLLVDAQATVVEDNDVSQDWLGPTKRFQNADLRLSQAIHRQDRPRVLRLLGNLDPSGKGQLTDVRLTRFDQTERQVDLHVARLPADFHNEARFVLVLLDRSIEAARLAEQGLFNALLDGSDDFIFATDLHGRLMLANSGFLGVVGVPRDRALGRKLSTFWPLDHWAEYQFKEADVLSSGHPVNFTVTLQWRPGQPAQKWALRMFPIRGSQGAAVGVASVCRNLSLESNAAADDRLVAQAFAALPMPVVLTDVQGVVQRVNPAWERWVGLRESSLLGHSVSALLDAQQTGWTLHQAYEHLLEHGMWNERLWIRHAAGHTMELQARVTSLRPAPEGAPLLLWVLSDTD